MDQNNTIIGQRNQVRKEIREHAVAITELLKGIPHVSLVVDLALRVLTDLPNETMRMDNVRIAIIDNGTETSRCALKEFVAANSDDPIAQDVVEEILEMKSGEKITPFLGAGGHFTIHRLPDSTCAL
jgi:hypothetical protein